VNFRFLSPESRHFAPAADVYLNDWLMASSAFDPGQRSTSVMALSGVCDTPRRWSVRARFGTHGPELPGVEKTAAVAQARAARSFPGDARRTLHWRTVFPQMTNWQPDEEAAELRFEFDTEIRRLEAA
jgi:hypothetical protein